MSTAALASFLLAVALAFVVPGPDFAIILRYAAQARSAGRAAAVGVIGGLCVHMSAAAFGLSGLLQVRLTPGEW